MIKPTALDLATLVKGIETLAPYEGGSLAEAASVALEKNEHPDMLPLTVEYNGSSRLTLKRLKVTQKMRYSYDQQDFTSRGACGVAILLIKAFTGMVPIRSYLTSGFDYWLNPPSSIPNKEEIFAARLEVSGIFYGKKSDIRRRVREKLNQVKPTDHTMLPAYVVVVEFGAPIATVVVKTLKSAESKSSSKAPQ